MKKRRISASEPEDFIELCAGLNGSRAVLLDILLGLVEVCAYEKLPSYLEDPRCLRLLLPEEIEALRDLSAFGHPGRSRLV